MLWVLMTKKGATIAMIACVLGASDTESENEVDNLNAFDQSDVVWAPHLGLVVANSFVETKSFFAILFA